MRPTATRQQRIAELVKRRAQIDAYIVRLGGPHAPPAVDRRPPPTADEWTLLARSLVRSGSTHAEVAAALGIPIDTASLLIARAAHTRSTP